MSFVLFKIYLFTEMSPNSNDDILFSFKGMPSNTTVKLNSSSFDDNFRLYKYAEYYWDSAKTLGVEFLSNELLVKLRENTLSYVPMGFEEDLTRVPKQTSIMGIEYCPMMFLFRHSLELYLKSVLEESKIYFDRSENLPPDSLKNFNTIGHNLIKLSGPAFDCIEYILEYEIGFRFEPEDSLEKFRTEHRSYFEKIVKEFQDKDSNDIFRYPTSTRREPVSPEFRLDFPIFYQRINSIIIYLDIFVWISLFGY